MNIKKLLSMVAIGVVAAVPLVAAGTAGASQTMNGCTVTASRPEWQPLSNGAKQVRGLASVRCTGPRAVAMQMGVREADANGAYDTYISAAWGIPYSLAANTTYWFRTGWAACRNTELGNEEAYVISRISVNGYVSAWDSGRGVLELSIAC